MDKANPFITFLVCETNTAIWVQLGLRQHYKAQWKVMAPTKAFKTNTISVPRYVKQT